MIPSERARQQTHSATGPRREAAETLALHGLVFLTEDKARLTRFLTDSGLDPAGLGEIAAHPEMLTAVLDHLLGDESLLMVFAAGAGLEPTDVEKARQALL